MPVFSLQTGYQANDNIDSTVTMLWRHRPRDRGTCT